MTKPDASASRATASDEPPEPGAALEDAAGEAARRAEAPSDVDLKATVALSEEALAALLEEVRKQQSLARKPAERDSPGDEAAGATGAANAAKPR
jgi:hypothetical protein